MSGRHKGRHRLNDPVLTLLYADMKRQNAELPPEKRIGFQTYCRQYGILAPEDWEAIRRFEVSVSDIWNDSHITEDD